jgi:hypothetical protein
LGDVALADANWAVTAHWAAQVCVPRPRRGRYPHIDIAECSSIEWRQHASGMRILRAARMTGPPHAAARASMVRRRRLVIVAFVVFAALCKLYIAATTFGTADVATFTDFADFVRKFGPIDIYEVRTRKLAHYNHPPLTSWMLLGLGWLADQGVPFTVLIRLPAILADMVTAVLAFELVRRHRPLGEATAAGCLIACSPILAIISGFHGNTDPLFVMLALLSFYLLTTGRSGSLAGISFAMAVSIKLVPIVALPLLLLVAARAGSRRLVGFLAGSAAFMALVWGPVVLNAWAPFEEKVLQYSGWGVPWWGLPELAQSIGASERFVDLLIGPGRFVMLLLAAGAPVILAWRRPGSTTPAFGLTLAMFLLLSTASATQYLAWAAAAVYLVNVWAATVYNAVAGIFLISVYNYWNNAPVWDWNRTVTHAITPGATVFGKVVWLTLLAVVVIGFWSLRIRPRLSPRRINDTPNIEECEHA